MDMPIELYNAASLREALTRTLDLADQLNMPIVAIRISEALDALEDEMKTAEDRRATGN